MEGDSTLLASSFVTRTGVRISNQDLVFATLECDPRENLRLHADGCASFRLEGREQQSLLKLRGEAENFLQSACIRHLTIRGNSARGAYKGSGLGFLIEGMLKVLPNIRVHTPVAQTISAWELREQPTLPHHRQELRGAVAKLELEAILAAAWAIHNLDRSESINNGSKSTSHSTRWSAMVSPHNRSSELSVVGDEFYRSTNEKNFHNQIVVASTCFEELADLSQSVGESFCGNKN